MNLYMGGGGGGTCPECPPPGSAAECRHFVKRIRLFIYSVLLNPTVICSTSKITYHRTTQEAPGRNIEALIVTNNGGKDIVVVPIDGQRYTKHVLYMSPLIIETLYAFTQRSRQLNIFFATTSRSPHLPALSVGLDTDHRLIPGPFWPYGAPPYSVFHEVTAQPYYKWFCAERVVESQVTTNVAYKVYILNDLSIAH